MNPAILYQMHIKHTQHITDRQQHKHPEGLSTQSRPHTADRTWQQVHSMSTQPRESHSTHSPGHPARNAGVHAHTGGKNASAISAREQIDVA